KNRFLSFCDKKQYRHPPVHISYIGVEDSFVRLLQKSNTSETGIKISKNYFVTVSTIEPRKNHLMLLQIWREMIEHKVENIPQLIILGKRGWNVDNVLDFLERSPSLKSYVIELSGVSDKQLVDILRNAKGMLFPSFVEGWGMPLVEALAMKIPVICSDIEAFRESGQMLAKYISPIDAKCWQNEIIKISNNSDYRNGLIKKIDSFKLPTWDECFRKLDEFISQIEEKNFYQAPINTAA
ncbi:TPA: glycosyltransferase, partial [Escherichia coli]|nr:glycosyltransferase [Escherichia coli]